MGGVKLVRSMCCISFVLCRSSVIFVLINVLPWSFKTVVVVAVKSFYVVACFLLLIVVSVLESEVGLVYVYMSIKSVFSGKPSFFK